MVWQAAPKVACDECAQTVGLGDVQLGGDPVEALKNADAVRGGQGALPKDQVAPRVITAQNDYIRALHDRELARAALGFAVGSTDGVLEPGSR